MRTKVGAGEIGGNVEEEIFGNHSYNISNNTKGRHGEDVDIIVGGNETRQINGTLDISVRSNIFATSLEGNFDMAATEVQPVLPSPTLPQPFPFTKTVVEPVVIGAA